MKKEITIPIILALGSGLTLYALTVKKEHPIHASTIFSIIGATAGLLTIGSAISAGLSAAKALRASQSIVKTVDSFTNFSGIGCPTCPKAVAYVA